MPWVAWLPTSPAEMLQDGGALAFGAGMIAALNPCGFALLPTYLALLVTGDDRADRSTAVLRALRLTAAMTVGFAAVFAVFGLVIAPVAGSAQRHLPWLSVAVGIAVMLAGVWLLAGKELPVPGRGRRPGRPVTGTMTSMFGYGITYALASLTCTVAPFLAVVVAAFRADSIATGVALFLLYAGGMGLVVGTAACAVALANGSVVRTARQLGRVVPVAGGVLLVALGSYVAYYGWWEIRVLRGEPAQDPVVEWADTVRRWLVSLVTDLGVIGFVVVLSVMVIAVLLQRAKSRRAHLTSRASRSSDPTAASHGRGSSDTSQDSSSNSGSR